MALGKERGKRFLSRLAKFRSIRTKLLVSHFMVMVLTVIAVGWVGYQILTRQLLAFKRQEMITHARLAADHLNDELLRLDSIMRRIAAGHEVKEFSDTYRDLALAAYFTKFRRVFPILSYVNAAGEEEVKVVNGEISETSDRSNCEAFRQSKKVPNTVRIVPHYRGDKPLVRFSYGIVRYFGNKFLGSVIGSLPFSELTTNLSAHQFKNGYLLVVSADGTILYSTRDSEEIPAKIRLRDHQGKNLVMAGLTTAGFEKIFIDNSEALLAHAPVEPLAISVLIVFPYKAFMAIPRQLGAVLIFVLFMLCLVGGPPLSFLIARKLSSPLVSLTKAVERISSGDLQPMAIKKVRDGDEVGNLINAYNRLAQDLQQTTISRDYFENILASMNESVVVLDGKGTIRMVNPPAADLLGYSRDELLGQSMSLIFPAYESMVVSSAFQGTPPPSRREIDCVYRTKEGKDLPVLFTHSLLRNRSGEIEGAICVALDIRKRKRDEAEKERLQQQLHQAQKMESIGTLAAGIAHDFNNLLTAILGFTDLARERVGDDHPIVEDLDQVRDAGRRATELVRQILAFSRETKQEKGPIQVQTLVKEILKLLRSSIPTNIEIEQRLDAAEIFIMADPTQIQQLVMNLCTNAAQALEASGGKLQVSLEAVDLTDDEAHSEGLKPGCYLRIIVSDSGPGMDEAILARIYDPFFTTKEVGKATGLGLSVVHGIIKAHHGTINVQSKPRQGTTFTIYLPTLSSAPASILQPRPPLLLGKEEHILAVDDEQAISMFLSQMLPEIGYRATVFSDSEEALAAFRNDPYGYDLVLTDQAMPRLQGTSLAKEMLRLRPDLPIILCTGYSNVVSQENCREIGIRDFMLKPFDRKTLAEAIRKVLNEEKYRRN